MNKRAIVSVLVLATMASGCSGFRKAVGVDKNAPDEFAVSKQAPLVVPPDFALRPPRPGAPRPTEIDSQGQAIEALFGVTAQPARSAGEQALLERAGATKAEPEARTLLRDDGTLVADKGVFLKELLATDSGIKQTDGITVQEGGTAAPKSKKKK